MTKSDLKRLDEAWLAASRSETRNSWTGKYRQPMSQHERQVLWNKLHQLRAELGLVEEKK